LIKVVQHLLDTREVRKEELECAFLEAGSQGHVEVVRLLLNRMSGWEIGDKERFGWVKVPGEDLLGEVLWHAAGNGHLLVVQELLSTMAFVSGADNMSVFSDPVLEAAYHAVERRRVDVVWELLHDTNCTD
jgi:hypothetical protein